MEGIDRKWERQSDVERKKCPRELATERAKRDLAGDGGEGDAHSWRPFSEYRENDHHPGDRRRRPRTWTPAVRRPRDHRDITRPLEWLDENGVCLSSGRLRAGPTVSRGDGVFAATTGIGEGEVLLTTPLIAMREEDFLIYKTDPTQEYVRNEIDKTSVVGTELLLNYAYNHPDSPLYLVPTAPLANLFNHGGPSSGGGANVRVRWPEPGSSAARLFEWAYGQEHGNRFDTDFGKKDFADPNPWLGDHPIDVMERSGKLAFEYVALREIEEGEELLIDYGRLWEESWNEYEGLHPDARTDYFRHSIGVPDGLFPENWHHVSDRYEVAEIRDLENEPLEPGVAVPLTWVHNGKPVGSKWAYAVGLESGFSERFLVGAGVDFELLSHSLTFECRNPQLPELLRGERSR